MIECRKSHIRNAVIVQSTLLLAYLHWIWSWNSFVISFIIHNIRKYKKYFTCILHRRCHLTLTLRFLCTILLLPFYKNSLVIPLSKFTSATRTLLSLQAKWTAKLQTALQNAEFFLFQILSKIERNPKYNYTQRRTFIRAFCIQHLHSCEVVFCVYYTVSSELCLYIL